MADIYIVYGGHLHAGFTVFDGSSNSVGHYADGDCKDLLFDSGGFVTKLEAKADIGSHLYNVCAYKKVNQFFKIIDASNHKVFNDLVVNIYHIPNKLPARAFCTSNGCLHYRWGYFKELLDEGKFPTIYQQRILKNQLVISPPRRYNLDGFKDINNAFIKVSTQVEGGAFHVAGIVDQPNIQDEIYRRLDSHSDVCIIHLQDVDPQQELKFESQHTNEYIYTNESTVFNVRGNRVKNSILI